MLASWFSSAPDTGDGAITDVPDMDAMMAQIHELQSQNNILACRVNEMNQQPEYMQDLEARVLALQDDRTRLRVEKDELTSNIAAMTAQNEELKARIARRAGAKEGGPTSSAQQAHANVLWSSPGIASSNRNPPPTPPVNSGKSLLLQATSPADKENQATPNARRSTPLLQKRGAGTTQPECTPLRSAQRTTTPQKHAQVKPSPHSSTLRTPVGCTPQRVKIDRLASMMLDVNKMVQKALADNEQVRAEVLKQRQDEIQKSADRRAERRVLEDPRRLMAMERRSRRVAESFTDKLAEQHEKNAKVQWERDQFKEQAQELLQDLEKARDELDQANAEREREASEHRAVLQELQRATALRHEQELEEACARAREEVVAQVNETYLPQLHAAQEAADEANRWHRAWARLTARAEAGDEEGQLVLRVLHSAMSEEDNVSTSEEALSEGGAGGEAQDAVEAGGEGVDGTEAHEVPQTASAC
eukprot:g2538.t1